MEFQLFLDFWFTCLPKQWKEWYIMTPVGTGVLVKIVLQYFPEPYPYLTIVISIQCHALA